MWCQYFMAVGTVRKRLFGFGAVHGFSLSPHVGCLVCQKDPGRIRLDCAPAPLHRGTAAHVVPADGLAPSSLSFTQ
jgi:hypothetical protein